MEKLVFLFQIIEAIIFFLTRIAVNLIKKINVT